MLCAKFVDAKTMTTWQFRNLKALKDLRLLMRCAFI